VARDPVGGLAGVAKRVMRATNDADSARGRTTPAETEEHRVWLTAQPSEPRDRALYGAGTDAGGRRRPRAAALRNVVWKTVHGFGKGKCFTDTVFGRSLASVRSNSGTPRASRS
jgi:hypothetical protein